MEDITRLAGLIFTQRGAKDADVDHLVASETPHDDLSPEQETTFRQVLADPDLTQLIETWWIVYDEKRATGVLSAAEPWWD